MSTAQKIRAVIFDMDGLLLDSEQLWIDCWTDAGVSGGYPAESIRSAARSVIGMNAQATRETFLRVLRAETGGAPREESTAGADAYERFYDRFLAEASGRFKAAEAEGKLLLKPGAEEILAQLHAGGSRLALATSTAREIAERQMRERGLWKYFDACAFGSEVAHSKPAPDVFLLAARRLDAAPSECCVLEDSFNGIRAAHAAGMMSIMVPDLLQPDAEIRALADRIVPDLTEALRVLTAPE